ncbi:protein of unknown function DUF214 [Pyrolobus fumarii 1A]|uniref:ABC3 transporter permease protein domain-containing protein n=1 Tax=Pyrolobus fumarii (strain DSM 11204 / 1A) TaxID=694429 RepID=G0EG36_PYRF1|nr:ABC transporter permease [Pyrolobus fumarii]AEM38284.1 protein of unknown function DUF214 [Pyrolobus fumarii 1A]
MSALVFLLDALRLAYKTLAERKTRAILTIIGVAIGPLALIAMVSVVKGYSNYILGQLEALGQNLVVVMPSQSYQLTERDLERLRAIPGVLEATPFYTTQGFVRVGTREVKVTVYATRLDILFRALSGLEVMEGGVPPENAPIYALVGYYVSRTLDEQVAYRVGDPIPVRLIVPGDGGLRERRATLIVYGVLGRFGSSPILNFDYSILLPLSAGRRVLHLDEWTGIIILVERADLVPNVTREIRDMYGDLVSVVSFQGIARVVSSITRAMESIAFVTSLSAFAVAVAGVSATMITSVVERVREIGVLKALGFTDAQVVTMILLEGLLISLIAGAAGVTAGIGAAYLLALRGFEIHGETLHMVIRAEPAITPELVAQTLLVTLLVGIAGSVIPAYRAARIPPAVALRYE